MADTEYFTLEPVTWVEPEHLPEVTSVEELLMWGSEYLNLESEGKTAWLNIKLPNFYLDLCQRLVALEQR